MITPVPIGALVGYNSNREQPEGGKASQPASYGSGALVERCGFFSFSLFFLTYHTLIIITIMLLSHWRKDPGERERENQNQNLGNVFGQDFPKGSCYYTSSSILPYETGTFHPSLQSIVPYDLPVLDSPVGAGL